MSTTRKISSTLFTACVLMALPFAAGAYEVNILDGDGAESKALNEGDYQVAIQRLEKRVQHGGTRDRDVRLTNLCTAYVVTGRHDKASRTCDEAVEANGEYVGVAFNSRGVLNAMKGDYIAALADFEEAADEANYPRVQREFADNMPSMRRYSKPEVDIEDSIQLAAKNHAQADQFWAKVQAKTTEKPGPEAE